MCDGVIARAKPSSAISATRLISAFVSLALVATRPIVVFSPGARRRAPEQRAARAACGRRRATCRPRLRTPATTLPVAGSMMSPTAFTATMAATTRPFGSGDRRPSRGRPSSAATLPILPTVAPAPAPTLPSATGAVGRGLRGLVAAVGGRPDLAACRRTPRSNRMAAGTIGTTPVADLPSDVAALRDTARRPAPHRGRRRCRRTRTTALTLSTMFDGSSRSVSRVPGAPPRCDTPPTAPSPSTRMTVQPVGRSVSV